MAKGRAPRLFPFLPAVVLLDVLLLGEAPFLVAPPAAVAVATEEIPSPSTGLFILGDSSVNCGNNIVFSSIFPHDLISFSLCHQQLLPDLIAKQMGLPPVSSSYSVIGKVQTLVAGVNFGANPATIISSSADGPPYGNFFVIQTLSQQVRQVFDVLHLLQLQLGPSTASPRVSAALFLLSFGKDDYIALLSAHGGGSESRKREISRILVSEMIIAVKELYGAGVRRMAVMGVAPLGCAPWFVWLKDMVQGLGEMDCIGEVNDIVAGYNTMLSDGLEKLKSELPGAQIVFCDVYQGMMEIISNPRIYGFEKVTDACCREMRCLFQEIACADPLKHVWWDLFNPTEAVNALLANWSWFGSQKSICKPMALQQLTAVRI